MIKFFRKIRQKLLSENKFSKYLIYAIGEIILVVIGILIALQINNANENKKLRFKETKTLKVIRDGIAKDTANLNWYREWLSIAENGINKAQIELAKEQPNDSLGLYLNLALMQIDFKLNRAPYESLKSNSPNIISNDSLKNAIIDFYEFRSQFIENSAERNDLINEALLAHSIDLFENISRYGEITEGSWYGRVLVPFDIQALKKDKRLLTLLRSKLANIQYEYTFSYTQGMKNLTKMLKALDNEIKKLEK